MSYIDMNYGAITKAREFWGGNNGFVTFGIALPSGVDLPGTTAYNTAKAAVQASALAAGAQGAALTTLQANQLIVSNAERNLFKLAQLLGQRAVVVAVTDTLLDTTGKLDDIVTTVSGNTIAFAKAGTTSGAATGTTPNVYVTFMIERGAVLTKQTNKPGSTYALTVDPTTDIVTELTSTNFFTNETYQADPSGVTQLGAAVPATGALVKVFESLAVMQ